MKFKQVDVFTDKKYLGNPVAVFFDADDLTTEQMQTMSRWTNLSETTFIVKPTKEEADYKVRIFTPKQELPFAGHPTLGTCFAMLESGLIKPENGKIVQECGAGLVDITVEDSRLWLKLPYHRVTSIGSAEIAELKRVLGVETFVNDPILVDDGPKWLTLQLESGKNVTQVSPDMSGLAEISEKYGWIGVGIFGYHENGTIELRNLAPLAGVPEDPACGSGAGAVGTFMAHYSGPKEAIMLQGGCIGRDARLYVRVDANIAGGDFDVFVGGKCVTCIAGDVLD